MSHSRLISKNIVSRFWFFIWTGRRKKNNLHSREIEDRTSGIPTVKTTTPWFQSNRNEQRICMYVIYSSEIETDSATRGCVQIFPCVVMVWWLQILKCIVTLTLKFYPLHFTTGWFALHKKERRHVFIIYFSPTFNQYQYPTKRT